MHLRCHDLLLQSWAGGLKPDLAAELLSASVAAASVAAKSLVVLLPGSIMRSAFQFKLQSCNTWYYGHEELSCGNDLQQELSAHQEACTHPLFCPLSLF